MMNSKSKEPKTVESFPSIQSNKRPTSQVAIASPPFATAAAVHESSSSAQNETVDKDELDLLQRKRKIIQNDIQRIIKKFDELKHRLYTNKERVLEQELEQLEKNTHPLLQQQFDYLEEQRNKRVATAKFKQELIGKSLTNEFETHKDFAEMMLIEGKKSIRRALLKHSYKQLLRLETESCMISQTSADSWDQNKMESPSRQGFQLLPKHITSLDSIEIENDLVLMNRS